MPWIIFLQNMIPYISVKYVVCLPEWSLHKYHITYHEKDEKSGDLLILSYCPAGNLARHFLGDMLYWKFSRIFIMLEDQVLFPGWHVTFYVTKTSSMMIFCTCTLSRLLTIS